MSDELDSVVPDLSEFSYTEKIEEEFVVDEEDVLPTLSEAELALADIQDLSSRIYLTLKALSINEKWNASKDFVDRQYEAYENMYSAAQRGEFDPEKNEAIIFKNEYAKAAVAPFIDYVNTIKDRAKELIEAGELEKANNIAALASTLRNDTLVITDEQLEALKSAMDPLLV